MRSNPMYVILKVPRRGTQQEGREIAGIRRTEKAIKRYIEDPNCEVYAVGHRVDNPADKRKNG